MAVFVAAVCERRINFLARAGFQILDEPVLNSARSYSAATADSR
jgi:hypothetical protein